MTRPWWFSGDDQPPQRPGLDLGSLAVGAQQLVDWARAVIVDPHAAHDDPAAHPQCPLCRASGLLGDPSRGASASGGPAARGPLVEWLELHVIDAPRPKRER